MSRPLVSIMIPTYNQNKYLDEAIKSALSQTYTPLEIIISDDASTSPRVSEILHLYKKCPNISVYINDENMGRAKNYHTTLYERTSGKWIINLDGDDYFYDPTYIERAISLIEKNPGLVMVSGRRLKIMDQSQNLIRNKRNNGPERVMNSEQAYQALLEEKYYYWHATTLYHRKTAVALGFYRYDMTATDDDSFLRLMACGDVGIIPVWASVWRKHDGNASRNQPVQEMIDNLKAFMAPESIIDSPMSKVAPAFLKHWMTLHLANRTKVRVRELLKTRRSLKNYFVYVWAIRFACKK
ncbi:glycosyltransferase family 2 protein [Desulfoplanes sp. PS50]